MSDLRGYTGRTPLPHARGQDQWENVPEVLKQTLTEQQWLWLSDAEKARLIESETEPEA